MRGLRREVASGQLSEREQRYRRKSIVNTVKQAAGKRRKVGQVLSWCLTKKEGTVSESLGEGSAGLLLGLLSVRQKAKGLGVDIQEC